MQGLDNDFNLKRLERYVVMLKGFKVEPIIIFNKTDLIKVEELDNYKTEIEYRYPGITILFISNFSKEDIEDILSLLKPGNTYCLIGSSGVGKSTLINNLS